MKKFQYFQFPVYRVSQPYRKHRPDGQQDYQVHKSGSKREAECRYQQEPAQVLKLYKPELIKPKGNFILLKGETKQVNQQEPENKVKKSQAQNSGKA